MNPASDSQPLKILVVSEDRPLHRNLSQFLGAVGYHVLQAAGPHSAMAAIEAEKPQFVVLESTLAARSNWALCGLLNEHRLSTESIKLLLVEKPDESLIEQAIEAGIDDFLRMPVDYGELLTRIRAAARLLEFDRRAAQQSHVDRRTGLMNRSALFGQVRRYATENESTAAHFACVVLDIDYLTRVNRASGELASDAVLRSAAQELAKLCGPAEMLGSLGEDRFCAFLPGASSKAAIKWAEKARGAIAATKFKFVDEVWQMTASAGVAGGEADDSPEHLLELASEACQTAKASGRNCVVRHGEFVAESLGSTEDLLRRTSAKDVMTACTVFLRPNESLGEVAELLQRTRLDAVPVVDVDGTLLGVCEQEDVAAMAASDGRTRLARDVMSSDVPSFDEHESLTSLLTFLTRDSRRLVVITSDRRPVGLVTCSGLAALWTALTATSYSTQGEPNDGSDYLLVPDTCQQVSQQTA